MKKILCFGDSITSCADFPDNRKWTALLQRDLDAADPGEYAVYNRGIGGNTTVHGLDRINSGILKYMPGIVLIEFGFNDASLRKGEEISKVLLPDFKANLSKIIQLVREREGNPILMTNHVTDQEPPGRPQANGRDYFETFRLYQIAIREVAQETSTALIDLEAEMQKAGVSPKDVVSEDRIHLKESASRIYADFVFRGLAPLIGLKPAGEHAVS